MLAWRSINFFEARNSLEPIDGMGDLLKVYENDLNSEP
jgi:hypothetical protein